MNNTDIQPISEIEADKRRLCEIRFDCLVTMHDSGMRETGGGFLYESRNLPPQWFRLNSQITLESIKYASEFELGAQLKQMYYELQQTIEKYEQSR
jgi:hypothetical protein